MPNQSADASALRAPASFNGTLCCRKCMHITKLGMKDHRIEIPVTWHVELHFVHAPVQNYSRTD